MRCVTFTPMTYLPSQIVFYVKERERETEGVVFLCYGGLTLLLRTKQVRGKLGFVDFVA